MEGGNDSGGDSEDDDDNDGFNFQPIGRHDLRILTVCLDDLHTGISSKQRFFRDPRDEDLRFLLNQEIALYINEFSLPYLRRLVYDTNDCKFCCFFF